MKRTLQTLAVLIALTTIIIWAAFGANRGFTKTEKQVKTMDEVTGIEGITYEKRFQPGLDFLGVGLVGGGILAGVPILFRSKSNRTNNQTSNH